MSNVNFIVAQILGLTATVILCLSYVVKDKKKFLLVSFVGEVVYGLTFIFVSSWGAGLISLLSCMQSLVFYWFDKKGKRLPKALAFVFVVLFSVIGALDFESGWDMIPILTYSWFTISLYFDNVQSIRLMYILPNAVLVVYDVMVMAYANAFEDGLETIFLSAITILTFIKSKRSAKKITCKHATPILSFRLSNGIIGVETINLQSAVEKVTTSDNHNLYPLDKMQVVLPCPIDRYG